MSSPQRFVHPIHGAVYAHQAHEVKNLLDSGWVLEGVTPEINKGKASRNPEVKEAWKYAEDLMAKLAEVQKSDEAKGVAIEQLQAQLTEIKSRFDPCIEKNKMLEAQADEDRKRVSGLLIELEKFKGADQVMALSALTFLSSTHVYADGKWVSAAKTNRPSNPLP